MQRSAVHVSVVIEYGANACGGADVPNSDTGIPTAGNDHVRELRVPRAPAHIIQVACKHDVARRFNVMYYAGAVI
jgi:hypothetical protein